MMLQEPERPEAGADRDELAAVRLWLRRRARRKVTRALQIETLRSFGRLPHEQIRLQMGLTVEQYRRAKRWLHDAVAQSVVSGGYLTVATALQEHGEHHVEQVLRLGMLKRAGGTREDIKARLGLSEDEFGACYEWWRDALTATRPRDG